MSDWLSPEIEWFLIGLVCMVAEIVLPGFIVIFFGVGAWVTAICIWAGLVTTFSGQLAVFILSTVVSLVLFRSKGKALFQGKVSGTMKPGEELDDLVGSRAVAVTDIPAGPGGGKVEFRGTQWEAEADVAIAKGAVVRVIGRKSIVLKVELM